MKTTKSGILGQEASNSESDSGASTGTSAHSSTSSTDTDDASDTACTSRDPSALRNLQQRFYRRVISEKPFLNKFTSTKLRSSKLEKFLNSAEYMSLKTCYKLLKAVYRGENSPYFVYSKRLMKGMRANRAELNTLLLTSCRGFKRSDYCRIVSRVKSLSSGRLCKRLINAFRGGKLHDK